MGKRLVIGLSTGAVAVVAGVVAVLLAPSAFSADDKPMKFTVTPHLDMAKEIIKDAVKETAGKVVPGVAPAVPGAAAPAAPAGAVAVPAPATAPAAPPADAASRAVSLRKKTLKEEDFLDHDETNRDPFKSFLRLFVERVVSKGPKVPAIFERFALEELTLIAVISGDANPRAMFRDPGGLGQTVKRGDYISKAAARITKILSDRVILEIAEATPSGDTKPLEKAILVNPEGAQK